MGTEKKTSGGGKEDLNETLARLDSEIEKSPEDVGLYHIKIALLLEAGIYEEAIPDMDRVLKIDPNDTKILFDRAEVLSRFGLLKEALDCYNKAVEIDHSLTKAWLGRGLTLLKLRIMEFEDDLEILDKERKVDLEDALDSLTVVTDRNPRSLPAWNGRAYALYTLHRYDEALECFETCIKINSDFIKAWYGKGKALMKLDKNVEAIQSFQRAVACVDKNATIRDVDTLICLANSFIELGQGEEAIDCINKFLEKEPHNPLALAGKGDILERLGRGTEALACYSKSVEYDPKRAYVWHKLGNLKNELGEFETALDCYNEAVQLISGFEEAWFKIGELLTMENKDEQAKECFSWVLEINPDNPKAKSAMSIFEEPKEFLGSLFKRKKKKYKDGKKRKKRKRKKSKEEDDTESYEGTEELPIGPEPEYYEETGQQMTYEESPLAPEPELIEEHEPFLNGVDKANAHEVYEEPEPQLTEQTEPEYPQPDFEEEQPLEMSPEYIEKNESKNVELPESHSGWEQDLNRIEPDVEEGSFEDEELDSDLDELQELIDDDQEEVEPSLGSEIQVEENYGLKELSEEELQAEKVSQENLEVLDNLLAENTDPLDLLELAESPGQSDPEDRDLNEREYDLSITDFFEPGSEKHELGETEQPDDTVSDSDGSISSELEAAEEIITELGELEERESQSEEQSTHNPNDDSQDEKEIKTTLEDLKEILVDDKAHLDGQRIPIKTSGALHLDGHPINETSQMAKLDAHGPGYMPPADIQASLEKLVNKGKLHMEKGEFEEAMNCFDMALELDPQCVDAWGAKGNLLLEMDEDEEE